MPVKVITDQDANDLKTGRVLVDFYASWCGPCQRLSPVFEKLSEEFKSILFAKVDSDVENELVEKYNVRSLPTVLLLIDGVERDRIEGFDKKALRDLLETL